VEAIVCVKPVPDAETRLRVRADGTGLDEEGVKFVLTGYDESAVEQALLLKEAKVVTSVRAISAGPAPRGEEVLRSAIALGCDHATWVEVLPNLRLDSLATARVLAEAVRRYPHDLVLVGKQAGDDEAGLVGPALAEYLGLPNFPDVVDLRWDAARSLFTFQQAIEGGALRAEVPAPVVLTLQQAWNDPRTAKLPSILKSRKAPIDRLTWAEVSPTAADRLTLVGKRTTFRLPPPRTGAKLLEFKTPDEAAEKLVRVLKEEAKVFP
jgi:electron transfer flavoprotein beta subunit